MESPTGVDSPSHDRNPSPPPELLERSDLFDAERIGDTIFSKHWLFTTLMKLIEEVDRENEGESELVVDVDEELQNELCKLWDMSMNSEVARFLNEFKAVEILTGIISKSKAPRVTEICVGILGNMACETTVCKEMVENQKFLGLMLDLLESRDVPTLVESTRLMYTSLSNTGAQGPWIKAIQRSEEFLQHVTFIFSSSTNCDLLRNTAELVDRLLDLENDLCVSWATEEFIQSLLEATDQIGSNHSAALEVYLNIFQSFSTSETGVEALVFHRERLGRKIMKYLNIVCEYEIIGLGGKEGPLASALSVLNILMNTQAPEFMLTLCRDEQLIRILLKILEPLYPILNHIKSNSQDNSSDHVSEASDQDQNMEPNTATNDADIPETDKSGMDQSKEVAENSDHSEEVAEKSDKVDNDSENNNENDEKDLADKEEIGDSVTKFDDLNEEEVQSLTVLHDVLSGFLLEYCKLVFKNQPSKDLNLKDKTNVETEESEKQKETLVTKETDIEMTGKNDFQIDTKAGGEMTDKEENQCETKETSEKNDIEKGRSEVDNQEAGEITSANVTDKGENQVETNIAGEVTDSEVTDKGDNPPDLCSSILTYLDNACSRGRINYLGLLLKETEKGSELFDELIDLGLEHEKDRLVRILEDVRSFRIVSRAESRKVVDQDN